MRYSEEKLRSYIERCFIDAFKVEHREYSSNLWSLEWIMIKNTEGVYQLYPILWCKFEHVLCRVEYRLQHNLMKNFGIVYKDTEQMSCLLNEDAHIDFNFTQAMFKTKKGKISLDIFDNKTNPYINGSSGECMVATTYEKLLFKYWNLNAESYKSLPENDKRKYLSDSLQRDWKAFKILYNETFDIPIGSYEIICSSGIEQI